MQRVPNIQYLITQGPASLGNSSNMSSPYPYGYTNTAGGQQYAGINAPSRQGHTNLSRNVKAMTSDRLLISTLVNRLGSRLPYNTRRRLDSVEGEIIVQQVIRSLVDLSESRLKVVVHDLLTLLDNINRQVAVTSEESHSSEVLESQLLILKVLGASMSHHWRRHRDASRGKSGSLSSSSSRLSTPQPRSHTPPHLRSGSDVALPTSTSLSASSSMPSMSGNLRSSGSLGRHPGASMFTGAASGLEAYDVPPSYGYRSNTEMAAAQAHSACEDPPALDGPMAKHILRITMHFLHITSHIMNENYASPNGAALAAAMIDSGTSYDRPGATGLGSRSLAMLENASNMFNAMRSNIPYVAGGSGGNTHLSASNVLVNAPSELVYEIHRAAGRILFYISASNWDIVFGQIKESLSRLGQATDDSAEMTEIRLLEWCNLNAKRLSMVLQGKRASKQMNKSIY
jgi:hypothetical protein